MKVVLILFLLAILNHGKADIQKRILGGKKVEGNKFPFIVSLQSVLTETTISKFCGGVLLSEKTILTAAHCLEDDPTHGDNLYAVAGVTSAFDFDNADYQMRKVIQTIPHPEYIKAISENRPAHNDIALLLVEHPFTFSKAVSKINLPDQDYMPDGDGEIAGWGASKNPAWAYQSLDLLYAGLSVVGKYECDEVYNKIDYSQFCLGNSTVSACGGDSGTPFVQVTPQNLIIVAGITSSIPTVCGDKPAVYTNVGNYVKWITDNLK